MAVAICCTVSAIRLMAIVTCLEPRACSMVARAIAFTICVDFCEDSWIFFSAVSASWPSRTPSSTFRTPRSIAVMAFFDWSCTARMSSEISLVEAPVRSARSLISSATTAKPLPCSPDWAARMAALSARRFVCSATSSMTLRMLPMAAIFFPSASMTLAASFEDSLILSMPASVRESASVPISASRWACSESLAVSLALVSTWLMETSISFIDELVSSVVVESSSMFLATSLIE